VVLERTTTSQTQRPGADRTPPEVLLGGVGEIEADQVSCVRSARPEEARCQQSPQNGEKVVVAHEDEI